MQSVFNQKVLEENTKKDVLKKMKVNQWKGQLKAEHNPYLIK